MRRVMTAAMAVWLMGPLGTDALRAKGGPPDSGAATTATIDAVALPLGGESITIDGALAEEIWSRATPVTDFVQRDPSEGAPSSHETAVRVAFDRQALYVAVQARDPEVDEVVGHLTRRDEDSPSDWVRVLVDSYRDQRTAYEFAVNAAGVKQDRYWFGDTSNDPGWDAVWDVAVGRDADGWHAEFRIPFSQLRFNAAASDAFGFALVRTIPHVNETATWPLLARSASGYVSSFGELRGLELSPAQKRFELAPYTLAQLATTPDAGSNPLAASPDGDLAIGLDLKYKVAPGLSLTATVNPDFGQVEADPAVVNLSAFETFFAERRPFFVEGSGNFSFDVDCNDGQCTGLFYSRRIGRSPQRRAAAPAGGFAAQPANTTILGAAKVTGRIGRFSIGALNAVTSEESARLSSASALDVRTSPVEPLTSYSVLRATREFDDNSRLGFMVTNTSRRLPDELDFLPESAVTGGVDADWRLGDGRYSLTGYLAGSLVRGSAAAIDRLQRSNVHSFQRPDAGHLTYDPTRTSLHGAGGQVSVSKISGERTRFNSTVTFKSPGFDINDLGFQARADEVMQSNWFQLRNDAPGRFVRAFNINVSQWAGWNFDGDLRFIGGNVNAHWTLINNWGLGAGVNISGSALADRLTRGGPAARYPTNLNYWGYVNTDNRRAVSGQAFVNLSHDGEGSQSWGLSPTLTVRPSSSMSLSVGVSINRNLRDAQWVRNLASPDGTRYVFGRLDQTTVGVSTRMNYTLTPTLTLQLYAQPFVSAGAYTDFRELTDGLADRYADRYRPIDFAANPDFRVQLFRTTNVLRWEYRPGSALFVVWQQGREELADSGDFAFGRDFGRIFSTPASNAFLVKFSRWFNF